MFNTPLNEEIFRREETNQMDVEFKKILDWYNTKEIKEILKVDMNVKFEKELRNIEKLIFKLFNAKIILKVDDASNPRNLSYGMMIFPSMQELKGKIRDAIEKEKEGFYLRSCTNVLVVIDMGLLTLLKKYNKNERYMTAVILHELGHKVYVRSQYEVRNKYQQRSVTLTLLGVTAIVPLVFLNAIIPFMVMAGIYGMLQYNSVNSYVGSEHFSDLTAVKYGYGGETYELMNIFYKLTENKRNAKSKALKTIFNMLNPSKMRRDEVENALKNELSDSKNSKEEKQLIKNALEEIKKIK